MKWTSRERRDLLFRKERIIRTEALFLTKVRNPIDKDLANVTLFVARSIGSLIRGQPALKEQSQPPTNDRRLEDLTGLASQSDGLFMALSLKGGCNEQACATP